jgi:CRP-like cAMP-binding protein
MAGSNLIFKPEQSLFKEGESPDGMYLVRRGELQVYLEKDGNAVKLASIGAGGMIGEMAFFDKKPRSASVKASSECEVTKISEDDFSKLMKQIPKWFVSIMTSLSTRLRETNERLQKLENKASGAKGPFEDTIRILHVLVLVWHKEGTKEGKSWQLNRTTAEKSIEEVFKLDMAWIKNLFDTLIKAKFFTVSLDNYKNQLLATANKAALSNLANFISDFAKENPTVKAPPRDLLEFLDTVYILAKEAPYDSSVIPLEEAIAEGDRQSLVTVNWKSVASFLKKPSEAITITKVSKGIGFKVNKVELPKLIENYKTLAALASAGIR